MYCTCNSNGSWLQKRHSNQNMSTAVCSHSGSAYQIQSNGPAIFGTTTLYSCLPKNLTYSQNHLHCSSASQLPQQPQSQNVTPWRHYNTCTCKPKCIFCTNSWWPTCPRLTGSQIVSNSQPTTSAVAINTSIVHQAKENQLNMSNGNCSPILSESPVPAPPPPQPSQRICNRCRFAIVDNHNGQPTTLNYGNASNSYTGKYYPIYIYFCHLQLFWSGQLKLTTFRHSSRIHSHSHNQNDKIVESIEFPVEFVEINMRGIMLMLKWNVYIVSYWTV